jgi:glycosyltransferase involved in cell wall biosynthesis
MKNVTIIIPNYNNAEWLTECIESCLCQDYLKEILIIDDHSTDSSWDVLESYKQKYADIIQIYKNPGKGACTARNFGLSMARGTYIQFLDSDDVLGTDKIKRQVECLEKITLHSLVFGYWGRFSKDIHESIKWQPNDLEASEIFTPANWLINEKMVAIHAWLIPKDLIDAAGLWNENLIRNQDGEFMCRLIGKARSIIFEPDTFVYYRTLQHSTISKRKGKKASESSYLTAQVYHKVLIALEDSDRTRKAIAKRYCNFISVNYPHNKHLIPQATKEILLLEQDVQIQLNIHPKLRVVEKIFGWKIAKLLSDLIFEIR